jgi:hypothetical protein
MRKWSHGRRAGTLIVVTVNFQIVSSLTHDLNKGRLLAGGRVVWLFHTTVLPSEKYPV